MRQQPETQSENSERKFCQTEASIKLYCGAVNAFWQSKKPTIFTTLQFRNQPEFNLDTCGRRIALVFFFLINQIVLVN